VPVPVIRATAFCAKACRNDAMFQRHPQPPTKTNAADKGRDKR
jgi:hypothetical protein